MTDLRGPVKWVCVAALLVATGTSCSRPVANDSSALRAEIDSVRAELGEARAECAALRAELGMLRADVRDRPPARPDRERVASLPGRLTAALALTGPSRRQDALARLALDAAELGDADITRGCIDRLVTPSQKQEVTYQSALRLARAGKTKEAVELANTLTTPSYRQKALASIAEGRKGD